jgi:hypothetical protein
MVALMPGALAATGWNVKPQALLSALESGAPEAWWIDTDVIVTENFLSRYAAVPPDHFVVAEEALYGTVERNGERARAWGFEVVRILPFCLNSGVMRATPAHLPLLRYWAEQLQSAHYLQAQRRPPSERPAHLLGDQDVLTACLAGPFGAVPLSFLRRGKDIIQYFGPAGYTPSERLRNLLAGPPCFIHSMGASKPWRAATPASTVHEQFNALYAELSPYKVAARQYREEYEGSPWTSANRETSLGALFLALGLRNAALTGFPLALAYGIHRTAKNALHALRRVFSGSASN